MSYNTGSWMKWCALGICLISVAAASAETADDIYNKGVAVWSTDPVAACECFINAAEQGHVAAMTGAGYCFENGIGTETDYSNALKWYQLAAGNHSVKACEGLARIYASCPSPEFHDGEQAVRFASIAVKQKPRDADALMLLARAYMRNMQIDEAMKYGKKAVRLCSSLEQADQFRIEREAYATGQPFPPVASAEWMETAADKGLVWSMKKLFETYSDRDGVQYAFEKARDVGHKLAEKEPQYYLNLGDLYFDAESPHCDLNQAYDCYRNSYGYNRSMSVRRKHCGYLKKSEDECWKDGLKWLEGFEKTEKIKCEGPECEFPLCFEIKEWRIYEALGEPIPAHVKSETIKPDPKVGNYLIQIAAKKGHRFAIAYVKSLEENGK